MKKTYIIVASLLLVNIGIAQDWLPANAKERIESIKLYEDHVSKGYLLKAKQVFEDQFTPSKYPGPTPFRVGVNLYAELGDFRKAAEFSDKFLAMYVAEKSDLGREYSFFRWSSTTS
jgi:hypothetical protein